MPFSFYRYSPSLRRPIHTFRGASVSQAGAARHAAPANEAPAPEAAAQRLPAPRNASQARSQRAAAAALRRQALSQRAAAQMQPEARSTTLPAAATQAAGAPLRPEPLAQQASTLPAATQRPGQRGQRAKRKPLTSAGLVRPRRPSPAAPSSLLPTVRAVGPTHERAGEEAPRPRPRRAEATVSRARWGRTQELPASHFLPPLASLSLGNSLSPQSRQRPSPGQGRGQLAKGLALARAAYDDAPTARADGGGRGLRLE